MDIIRSPQDFDGYGCASRWNFGADSLSIGSQKALLDVSKATLRSEGLRGLIKRDSARFDEVFGERV